MKRFRYYILLVAMASFVGGSCQRVRAQELKWDRWSHEILRNITESDSLGSESHLAQDENDTLPPPPDPPETVEDPPQEEISDESDVSSDNESSHESQDSSDNESSHESQDTSDNESSDESQDTSESSTENLDESELSSAPAESSQPEESIDSDESAVSDSSPHTSAPTYSEGSMPRISSPEPSVVTLPEVLR